MYTFALLFPVIFTDLLGNGIKYWHYDNTDNNHNEKNII